MHHLVFHYRVDAVAACGFDPYSVEEHWGTTVPAAVDCEACLASKVYKDTIILIEIGFEGNIDAYRKDLSIKENW